MRPRIEGKTVRIRATKAVIVATGGHSGNVNFRRIFDPRLTEEYDGVAGEPYSFQDASGEIAAMAIGASLWGAYNQVAEFGQNVTKPGSIGCQYGYVNLSWQPGSKIFSRARATGLRVKDWQNLILVNQAGLRFYDETKGQYTANNYGDVKPYKPDSYLNAAHTKFDPANFLNAAMAGTGEARNGGGPIWAIFDADAANREQWTVKPPYVDSEAGYFFSGNSIAELAATLSTSISESRCRRAFCMRRFRNITLMWKLAGIPDFEKPAPKFKIQTPPFYAAWATPVIHDSRAGLRINGKGQVVDLSGNANSGALLRRRIGRRLRHARIGPLHRARPDRRQERGIGEDCVIRQKAITRNRARVSPESSTNQVQLQWLPPSGQPAAPSIGRSARGS